MGKPQPGLFAEGLPRHHHVEFRLRSGVSIGEVSEAITAARRAATWLGGPNVTWGFSPDLWRQLDAKGIPNSVQPFQTIIGSTGINSPATQWDIWVWAASYRSEDVAEVARQVIGELNVVAELQLDLACYKAVDSRDPTGFIDGTENPLPDEAYEVACFPPHTPGRGGSAVLVQKWVHDMTAFDSLTEHAQEEVFGRTRQDSIQFDDDVIAPTSHVKRNTVLDDEGEERHIYRRNTPFSNSDETGTQFIGASNDPALLQLMLDRMFGVVGDGFIDHLINFSKPKTGSYYFVPAMEALTAQFGPLKAPDSDEEPEVPDQAPISDATGVEDVVIEVAPTDQPPAAQRRFAGLSIGSLKGQHSALLEHDDD